MRKIDKKVFLTLWLLNPFMSAIYLFKNFKQNTNIGPYLLLAFFFGISFVISTDGADSMRYSQQLTSQFQKDSSLDEIINEFYAEEGGNLDIYQPVITWLVSLVTDNAKVLFAIFSLIFGYFWFKSLIIIRAMLDVPFTGLVLVTFIFFALINPIWAVNGVRMWTAIAMFFYGTLLIHLQNDKKGWFFIFLPLFVHFSLIIAVILYVVYKLVPYKNGKIIFLLFLATFFFGELDLAVVRSYFEQLPGLAQSKQAYLSDATLENIEESYSQYALHVVVVQALMKYTVFFITVITYYYVYYKKTVVNAQLENIFKLGLVFASFSNLAVSIPSGGRFIILSNLLLLSAFLLFLNQKAKMPVMIVKILYLSFLVMIVFKIREGLDFIGVFFFLGNSIVNWFIIDTPLIDSVKSIF